MVTIKRRDCLEALTLVGAGALLGSRLLTPSAHAAETGLRFRGVDLGMLLEVEEKGGRFYDGHGNIADPVRTLAGAGANLVRLRLWVDPYTADGEAYGGGTNDLARTIALAQRAKSAGMDVLLDFHLSDWWADPGTQTKPKAWRGLSGKPLQEAVRSHVYDSLVELGRHGVRPAMVQMGNEISSGILWPDGRVGGGIDDFSGLGALLSAGFEGMDQALGPHHAVKKILHLDMGGDNALYRWWFDGVVHEGVDFDVIGLSYYPFWHRSMGELKENLNDLVNRYAKDILIVETAYGWTLEDGDGITDSFYTKEEAAGGYPATVEGQTAYLRDLRDLIAAVPDGHGLGYVWWEPAWLPVPGAYWGTEAGKRDNDDGGVLGNPWDNQTLFDFDGHPLSTMTVLGEPSPTNILANGSFEKDGYTSVPSGWGRWSPGTDNDASFVSAPGVRGDYKLTHWKDSAYVVSNYQVLSGVAAGTYRVEAWVLCSGGQNAAYMYAKRHGGSERQVALPQSPGVWTRVAIEDLRVSSGKLEIGFYSDAQPGNWINVDDVRVFAQQ